MEFNGKMFKKFFRVGEGRKDKFTRANEIIQSSFWSIFSSLLFFIFIFLFCFGVSVFGYKVESSNFQNSQEIGGTNYNVGVSGIYPDQHRDDIINTNSPQLLNGNLKLVSVKGGIDSNSLQGYPINVYGTYEQNSKIDYFINPYKSFGENHPKISRVFHLISLGLKCFFAALCLFLVVVFVGWLIFIFFRYVFNSIRDNYRMVEFFGFNRLKKIDKVVF